MKHIKTLVKGKACVTMVGMFDMVEKAVEKTAESKDVLRSNSRGKGKKGDF